MGHHVNELAIEPVDRAEETAAESERAFGDSVEDGLHVRRRARDHPQNLASRRLLLARRRQRYTKFF
jgi:hypothetical protein